MPERSLRQCRRHSPAPRCYGGPFHHMVECTNSSGEGASRRGLLDKLTRLATPHRGPLEKVSVDDLESPFQLADPGADRGCTPALGCAAGGAVRAFCATGGPPPPLRRIGLTRMQLRSQPSTGSGQRRTASRFGSPEPGGVTARMRAPQHGAAGPMGDGRSAAPQISALRPNEIRLLRNLLESLLRWGGEATDTARGRDVHVLLLLRVWRGWVPADGLRRVLRLRLPFARRRAVAAKALPKRQSF